MNGTRVGPTLDESIFKYGFPLGILPSMTIFFVCVIWIIAQTNTRQFSIQKLRIMVVSCFVTRKTDRRSTLLLWRIFWWRATQSAPTRFCAKKISLSWRLRVFAREKRAPKSRTTECRCGSLTRRRRRSKRSSRTIANINKFRQWQLQLINLPFFFCYNYLFFCKVQSFLIWRDWFTIFGFAPSSRQTTSRTSAAARNKNTITNEAIITYELQWCECDRLTTSHVATATAAAVCVGICARPAHHPLRPCQCVVARASAPLFARLRRLAQSQRVRLYHHHYATRFASIVVNMALDSHHVDPTLECKIADSGALRCRLARWSRCPMTLLCAPTFPSFPDTELLGACQPRHLSSRKQ